MISRPLNDLLKKDNFRWSAEVDSAFVQLKEALTIALVLELPNAHKTFVVETDTNGYGIGVILMP